MKRCSIGLEKLELVIERLEEAARFPLGAIQPIRSVKRSVHRVNTILEKTEEYFGGELEKTSSLLKRTESSLDKLLSRAEPDEVFGTPLKGRRPKIKVATALKRLSKCRKRLQLVHRFLEQLKDALEVEEEPTAEEEFKEETPTLPGLKKPAVEEFIETAREKGWKIGAARLEAAEELQRREASKIAIPVVQDGFHRSCGVIDDLSQDRSGLLPPDETFGLIRFPIVIISQNGKFADTTILAINRMEIGYSFHKVYDNYIVVDGMVLMGIHKNLMRVYDASSVRKPKTFWKKLTQPKEFTEDPDQTEAQKTFEKLKVKLDIAKFRALLPFMRNEFPEFEAVLDVTNPANPAKLFGDHYYAPLLPYGGKSMAHLPKLTVESWSPLFAK